MGEPQAQAQTPQDPYAAFGGIPLPGASAAPPPPATAPAAPVTPAATAPAVSSGHGAGGSWDAAPVAPAAAPAHDPYAAFGGIPLPGASASPALATPPGKQTLTDIAKAALTNRSTVLGPTTMLGAPVTPQQTQELSGASELLHGQISQGMHDIWAAEAPHVIQGSPVEKLIQTFRPDFHGAITSEDAASARAAHNAPVENAPVDIAQHISKEDHPVLKAVTELVQSVLSPANVSVMIATGGLGMVDNPVALAVANRLIAAGFGAQAAAQLYKHSERFKEAYDRGDASEALYQLTHAVGSGVVSYLAANHAATGGQLPIASEFDKNVAGNVSGAASNILTKLNSLVPNSTGSATKDLSTAEDLLYKAAPPTKGQAANGYRDRLHAAMPQLQEIAKNNPVSQTPVEMADAIDQHIETQEASIRNRARQLGADPTAQVDGLESSVNAAMNKVLKDKTGGYDEAQAEAAKDAILNSLRKGTGTEPRELSLEEAENLRQTWNEQVGKANGPMAQTAPGIADSLKDAAVKAMRDKLDSHYAKVGVEGVQEWRQQEAPLIDVRDALYDAAKKSIDAGKWSLMKSITKQKGGWGLLPIIFGSIAGGPLGGAAGLLADVGIDWLNNRSTNPNVLTQRAHETLQDVNAPSGAALPQVNPGPPTPAAPAGAAPQATVAPAASATPQVAVVGRVATPAEAAEMQTGNGVEITHSGDANGPNEVKLKVDGDDKGYLVFNHNGSTASVVSTQIFDKADQSLGYGQQMLNEAALKAKMQGSKALTSDENGDMTESAKWPWEALIRKGQPVERITLPNGKLGYSWDLTKIDAEGKPIPEEEGKAEAPKAKPAKPEANKGGDERAAAQPVVSPGPPPASNPHTAAPASTSANGPRNYTAAAARGIANPNPVGPEQKPATEENPQTAPTAPLPAAAGSQPANREAIKAVVTQRAQEQGLRPGLYEALIQQESGYNPRAISDAGAKGLAQMTDQTAQELGLDDPYDVDKAASAGARYLRTLLTRFNGNERQALGAYNWGPTRVRDAVHEYGTDWLQHAPEETQHYVRAIEANAPRETVARTAHTPELPHPIRSHTVVEGAAQ